MFKVYFTLYVSLDKYSKVVSVSNIPQKGSLIKAANHSFIVSEHEQDLDAYIGRDYENGAFCDSVRASVNNNIYKGDNYDEIRTDLRKAGWVEQN